MQWERLESVSRGWPTPETSRNTAFVLPVAEALSGGAAADTSWPAWNNAWQSILMPAAYASTKSVKGYKMLATLSLDKSNLSLEVKRSFNLAVTSLFPFFNVWLEQATRGFYGNGRRSFCMSSISLPRLDYWFILIFSVSSLSKCLAFPSYHPCLHCEKGKIQLQAIPNFAVGVCNRKQGMQY